MKNGICAKIDCSLRKRCHVDPWSTECDEKRELAGLQLLTERPTPPPPAPEECGHEYALLSSVYRISGRYSEDYTRIDEFYCKKCLDIQSKTRIHSGLAKPDWWKS